MALDALPGVTRAKWNYKEDAVTVTHDPALADLDALVAAVQSTGFNVAR